MGVVSGRTISFWREFERNFLQKGSLKKASASLLRPGAPEAGEKRHCADGGDGIEKEVGLASGFEAEEEVEEAERKKDAPGELE